jgi:Domain of unknown function (DUF1707)
MARSASLRASDADRDLVAERLRQATVDGRLDADELEERLHAALRARTYGELRRLVADLPGPRPRGSALTPRPSAFPLARTAFVLALRLAVVLAVVAAVIVVAASVAVWWFVWALIWLTLRARRGPGVHCGWVGGRPRRPLRPPRAATRH